MSGLRNLATALLVGALLAGCSSKPQLDPSAPPPLRSASDFPPPTDGYASAVYDPIEGFNRGVYYFNARFDQYVFLPVVNAYQFVTPDPVEDRVSDFFSNLTEIGTFINSMLQFNFPHAERSFSRFFINTTVGLLGFVDVATPAGYVQEREDFGQTLGVWGAGEGPFIMLPIAGPSNLRDTSGLVVSAVANTLIVPDDISDELAYKLVMWGLKPIDTRANTGFRYFESGSPFEYDLIRWLYTEYRRLQIAR